LSGVTDKKVTGVFQGDWSAAIQDYPIASGWTYDGGALVVCDSAGGVHVFDAKLGELLWSERCAHEGGALAMSVHPVEAVFATAGQDGNILIWDLTGAPPRCSIEVGGGWVENLLWSPDGARLASSHGREIQIFSVDGTEQWRSDEHLSTVSALGWLNSNELVSTCYGRVTIFDAATGEHNERFEWKGSLVSLALSPDGDVIACGSQDNSVHFWRRSTGEDSMMSGYPGKPTALAFDSTGTLLATGGGEAVTVWSFEGNGPEGTYPGSLELHERAVSTLNFTPDGLTLASGGRDGLVFVWSLQSDGQGRPEGAAMLESVIAEVCWRPDGRALAALDGDGFVTVWKVSRPGSAALAAFDGEGVVTVWKTS